MKTLLLSFFIAVVSSSVVAQGYITITGRVLEKGTNRPIAYANVGLPAQGIGTVSSQGGAFTLKVPNRYANQEMEVSFIGYKTYRRPIRNIKAPITIYLRPTTTELAEIVVTKKRDGKDIVRTAIEKVEENYPKFPTNVLAFYRESLTDQEGAYEYLAEGVLRVHKDSYKNKREGDVGLVQARMFNLKNPLDTNVESSFSSGHMAGQRFDVVRNQEDFINERFLKAYDYLIEYTTTWKDQPVWVISFDANPKYSPEKKKIPFWRYLVQNKREPVSARMKGTLYIEQKNYAIVRAEFEVTPGGLEKVEDYPLYAGRWEANTYVVNYQKINDKWHFSNALREGKHRGGEQYTNEVIITENDGKKGKAIPYESRMSRGSYFVNLTGEYDDNFWKGYNTAPMNEKLKESVRQMKNAQKSSEVFAPERVAAVQELRDSLAIAKQVEALEKEQAEESQTRAQKEIEEQISSTYQLQKFNNRGFNAIRFNYGLGAHHLPTANTLLRIDYLTPDFNETILSGEGEIAARDFEYIWFYDIDIYFGKHFFTRFGRASDFYNSIYRDTHIGLGVNWTITKGRPISLRLLAQHNRLRYARKLATANNDFGEFQVNSKRYTADKVNLYYGSFTRNLKFTGEFAIELRRNRSLALRGSYYLPIQTRQEVYLWEREQLFRRKEVLSVSRARVNVSQSDLPFEERLIPDGHFVFTLAYSFY